MSTIDRDPGRTSRTLWAPELCLPFIVWLAVGVVPLGSGSGDLSSTDGVVLMGFWAVILLLTLWLARCRVTLTRDEIIHRGFLRTTRVRAQDVVSVTVLRFGHAPGAPDRRSPGHPSLILKDGSRVGLFFAGGYLIGAWKNIAKIRGFYRHLADDGLRATAARRERGGARTEARGHWATHR